MGKCAIVQIIIGATAALTYIALREDVGLARYRILMAVGEVKKAEDVQNNQEVK